MPPSFSLVDAVDAVLPQTQCTKCGFDGCRPYAQAIVDGSAPINRCPPGGARGIRRLADLLGRAVAELDPGCGTEGPLRVAIIDEALCIGCTLCIDACPVDAIVGASRQMHTVIASHCTGCDLCVAPCPMDCIAMQPVVPPRPWTDADAATARGRMLNRRQRLAGLDPRTAAAKPAKPAPTAERRAAVEAARARARERRVASARS
jgi:electron transport complex protein RnfB